MSHMVIFRTVDGQPGYQEADELHDAVQFVESLRNRRGVEHARIFAMEEVPFDFKPYFRVELGEEPGPVPDRDDVVRVEDLAWSEPIGATTEPEPEDASVAPLTPPPPPPYDLPLADNGDEGVPLTESTQIPGPPPPPSPAAEGESEEGDSVPGARRGLFGR